ncbi:MAG: replicative DNA helicase [Flammeovirgaceae bacterium]|jgi:replicative DNA helicase
MASDNFKDKKFTKKDFVASGMLGKIPPHDAEIEQAVLGALMLEKEAIIEVIEILRPTVFYSQKHIEIYTAIRDLFSDSEPVDILTVTNRLRVNGKLDIVGGAFYITQLTNRVNQAGNIVYYARILLQYYIKREMITISTDIQKEAYEDTTDVFNLLDQMEQSLFAISELNIRKNYADMRSIMAETIKDLEDMKDHQDGLTGVPSGFTRLDRVTSGWQKSDLIILAARPAMGKCLGKGTKILMFDGSLRKVENVAVGDLLMGDDSTARKVLSLARGRENMYWIRQNKSIDYRVNESHILSLKRSRNDSSKHKNGDVLNISVAEYNQQSAKFKSNYKGYKVGVEFAEKSLEIPPYFMGIWLGDGRCSDPRITSNDREVVEYMEEYASDLKMSVSVYEQEDRCTQYAINNGYVGSKGYSIIGELRKMQLIENKHIPNDYLINSEENRLLLLAGLIDSDGHYDIKANGFEIVQKNKKLAEQIKFLCDTLGFRVSIKEKKATIKSIGFESIVYRVRFFGDLDKVPTRIARKQARPWTSRTNWQATGIQIEFDKVDDYYGFELDGNRLFLLEDMTVTHNTAFVVTSMRNAAVEFGKPVAIFSLEMASTQLAKRLISAEAELESEKLKTAQLTPFEWEKLVNKTAKLTNSPIFIDDTPAISVLELRAKCRRLKAQHDIQMVIIDYLQLMTAENKSGNREQEIAFISRSLKQLAKELNVPVIALSQLSRAVETRGGDKRPQLSDLRESGSIEQDADMVIFLYRPEYYGITEDEEGNSVAGMGEVIIAKHRNGSLENVPLRFIGKYTKFTDWETDGFIGASGGGNSSFDGTMPSDFEFDNSPPAKSVTMGSKMNQDSTEKTKGNGLKPPSGDVPF